MTDQQDDKNKAPLGPPNSSTRSPRTWGRIQADLTSALNSWEELTRKLEGSPSAEEKNLQEMRALLDEIKSKMQDLSKP